MTSAKSYAKAYLATTESIDTTERLAWLMALRARAIQRAVVRLLQSRERDKALAALDVPPPISQFLRVLADDRALPRLEVIAEQALTLAFRAGQGVPIRLTVVDEAAISEELTRALGQAGSGPVLTDTRVDPRLIGGVRAEIGNIQIDRSVTSRLAGLKRALAH